jgi:hypothetical protein
MGDFAGVGPGGSSFLRPESKTGGLFRWSSPKPFLTYQTKDYEKKASPSKIKNLSRYIQRQSEAH